MACAVVIGTVLGSVLCVVPLDAASAVDGSEANPSSSPPCDLLSRLYTDSLMNVVLTIQSMSQNPPASLVSLSSVVIQVAQSNSTVVMLLGDPKTVSPTEISHSDNITRSQFLLDFIHRLCSKEMTEQLSKEGTENERLRKGNVHDILKDGGDDRQLLGAHVPSGPFGELLHRVVRKVFHPSSNISVDMHLTRLCSVAGIVYSALVNPQREHFIGQAFGMNSDAAERLFSSPGGPISDLTLQLAKGLHAAKRSNDKYTVSVLECIDHEQRMIRVGARLCRLTSGIMVLLFAFSPAAHTDPSVPFHFQLPMTTATYTGPKAFGNYDVLVEVMKIADGLEKVFHMDLMVELAKASSSVIPGMNLSGDVGGEGSLMNPRGHQGRVGVTEAEIPHELVDYVQE